MLRCKIKQMDVLFFLLNGKRYNTIIRREQSKEGKNCYIKDEELKKNFEKISKGSPPRAKINNIINFLMRSNILSNTWSKLEIIDEMYKRKIDKELSFHINVLYGMGSKGINLNKKGIIPPILFLPLIDYEQFKYFVKVMQIADREKTYNIHKQQEYLHNFFKK
ncbi:hypothetical protein PFAG_00606 [Plasmodium falciparum Santa Lucia]|uniref:Uncharacterized protein n=12 Tax=Plasmodium falciparum TaxID=5833 RepID=Q8I1Y7_PLAF7|nr:conserved Plasmodium protein, unknown function [Plasmodium falciparum 3D7]ETW15124.1 hypothetical protein PFFVO_05962 [Plasmodium falciparum Vietnam Oak-Knoll (FVO)]ETW32236.1 hypothetical protein PFFCH_00349 [Plasmodium falciparum FCH/4]ETW44946.1 hypothetical protein PFNF135_00722 [Plasmodium falciparum NF135/5.C10]ETW57526.1 hypothetical protein PFUGPA_00430 [Plasmodium falciparum Palo Alto/Uganda]EUR46724.1 hypothetical protein PFBG_06202 [Plasmodium falciparum 7G8]EUT91620.1 hypotheti|eukprot:XP_001351354.1 conserved Plasmodium protein, unknown function [Plasmodium falciparum 3D7]